MKYKIRRLTPWLTALSLAVLFALVGCAPAKTKHRVYWPPPPEVPRLEFLGVYASQNDFPKTGWQNFAETLLGTPAPDRFKTPLDAVLDSKGRAYISDLHSRSVKIYDFAAKTVTPLTDRDDLLQLPSGLAIDSRDRLYVADSQAGQIVVFGPDHQVVLTIKHPDLVRPAYLCIDEAKDRLYVSDGKESKVAVFDLQGRLIRTFGQGKIYFPQGIAVAPDGRIFVAESIMARIAIFSPEGELLEKFGERGDQAGQFEHPKDLAIDQEGKLFVLDARKPGLIIFNKELQTLLVVSGARSGNSPLRLDSPGGLFLSASGRILIVDRLMRWFAIWQELTPAWLAEHPVNPEELLRIEAEFKALTELKAQEAARDAKPGAAK